MSERINKPRGTLDYIDKDEIIYSSLETKLFNLASCYGAKKVMIPCFEETKLFVRSVGDSTDIVNKEMFKLENKGDHEYVLRPEFTAGINRCIVENKLFASPDLPIKLSYCGPVFRYERPQAGRLREFHQFGVEFIDNKIDYQTAMDAICLLYRSLESILEHDLELRINFLGSKISQDAYRLALKEYYKDKIDDMCEDCKRRYQTNILRILDCKISSDIQINKQAPLLTNYLTSQDREVFDQIIFGLEKLNINYKLDPRLVRGLDYYTGIVFEVYDPSNLELGAIGAGGQYGNLMSEIGGPNMEGIGFSIGMERIILALSALQKENIYESNTPELDYFIIDLRKEKDLLPLEISDILRSIGCKIASSSYSKALNGSLKMADRLHAKTCLIFDDYNPNHVIVKNMKTRQQDIIPIESSNNLVKYLLESEKENA